MIVSVDEVKAHLRIEHNEEDSYIEGLIKQAPVSFAPGPHGCGS